jgi:crotonobetainyl-CoA:carnitine CoA-transferase CaiB-like acyl-CoA transferase
MADIFAEPHYRERDMIIDVPEPTLGSLPQPGVVPKLSRTPGRVTHAGPPLGQHTEEILRELLQMSPREIEELRQEGVI